MGAFNQATSPLSQARQEHQAELSDLDFVAVVELAFFAPLPVDIGTVQGADVAHQVALGPAEKLGVTPGHGDVIEEDVAVGMPANSGDLALEDETRACVRAALHYEDPKALRDSLNRNRNLFLGGVTCRFDRQKRDRRR